MATTTNGNSSGNGNQVGRVVQIIGPVVDVEFDNYLQPIYQDLRVLSVVFDVPTPIYVVC